MRMDPGVDTGPMLSQQKPAHPARRHRRQPGEAHGRAGRRACLIETLPSLPEGACIPQAQDDSQATYAPMIKKEDGELDFSLPAESLARRVRAFNPWPGTYHTLAGAGSEGAHSQRGPGRQPPARAAAHL